MELTLEWALECGACPGGEWEGFEILDGVLEGGGIAGIGESARRPRKSCGFGTFDGGRGDGVGRLLGLTGREARICPFLDNVADILSKKDSLTFCVLESCAETNELMLDVHPHALLGVD